MSKLARRVPVLPDWSAVTAPAARQALDGIVKCWKRGPRAGTLEPQAAAVLATILRHYAAEAAPPTLNEIGRRAELVPESVRKSIDLLHRLDFVLVDCATRTIRGAYPFIERATRHNVTFSRTGRTLSAMCAIDALGAGSMCRENVAIASACGFCGLPIAADVNDFGMTLGAITPGSTVVWVGLKMPGMCAAETVCTEMLFFCCADHLERSRASGDRSDGCCLSTQEAFQIGKALFIDRALLGTGSIEAKRDLDCTASSAR